MNKKEMLDLAYKHRIKIFLFGLLLIVLTFAVMVHDAREITAANMNPELQCNRLGYYNDFSIMMAKELNCEYTETGWHYKNESGVCSIEDTACLK
jgi:hypothetical protein